MFLAQVWCALLALTVGSAWSLGLRSVGPLSPGAVLIDPAADPRTETTYQDCATAEPLATVPAAARPLVLRWVRVRYRGTTPAPDLEGASRWIGARLPVSEVVWTVSDLEYQGQDGVDAFWWVLYTLYDLQTKAGDWESIYVGILPSGAQAVGWEGKAIPGETAVVVDGPDLARIAGHEIGHVCLYGPHDACVQAGCQPLMSLCGGLDSTCLEIGSGAWKAIWAALYRETD